MSFFNFKPIAIKAVDDTKAAAAQATVDAIKKLAQKPSATMPDVTVTPQPTPPAPAGLVDKWNALPTWMRYTAYAIGALALMKAAAPSGD